MEKSLIKEMVCGRCVRRKDLIMIMIMINRYIKRCLLYK